jgi:hypothetical protein
MEGALPRQEECFRVRRHPPTMAGSAVELPTPEFMARNAEHSKFFTFTHTHCEHDCNPGPANPEPHSDQLSALSHTCHTNKLI